MPRVPEQSMGSWGSLAWLSRATAVTVPQQHEPDVKAADCHLSCWCVKRPLSLCYTFLSLAVLVWARALGLLTPLSSKLGAMLYILRRAAEEVVVLVPVVLVLMLVSSLAVC